MRLPVLFVMLFALTVLADYEYEKSLLRRDDEIIWNEFLAKFNRIYENEEEMSKRKLLFMENLNKVRKLNDKNERTLFGMNSFSDRFDEEIPQSRIDLGNHKPIIREERDYSESRFKNQTLFSELHSNKRGATDPDFSNTLTPIKNSMDCTASEIFAAVAVIESMYSKKKEEEFTFSEQAIINCCKLGCDSGCDEKIGSAENIFSFVKSNGLPLQKDFDFANKKGSCESVDSVVSCSDTVVMNTVKDAVLHITNYGPIVGVLNSKCDAFKFYQNGIILKDPDCIAPPTHAVALVGYGYDASFELYKLVDYWIVKNSWGDKWGEDGYARILMDYNSLGLEQQSFVGIKEVSEFKTSIFSIVSIVLSIVIAVLCLIIAIAVLVRKDPLKEF